MILQLCFLWHHDVCVAAEIYTSSIWSWWSHTRTDFATTCFLNLTTKLSHEVPYCHYIGTVVWTRRGAILLSLSLSLSRRAETNGDGDVMVMVVGETKCLPLCFFKWNGLLYLSAATCFGCFLQVTKSRWLESQNWVEDRHLHWCLSFPPRCLNLDHLLLQVPPWARFLVWLQSYPLRSCRQYAGSKTCGTSSFDLHRCSSSYSKRWIVQIFQL